MSIFDGAQPAGWTALNDEQKARAAALAVGFRFTGETDVDQIGAAVFILDGAESYALHRRIMSLPDEEQQTISTWGGQILYAGGEDERS